MARNQNIFIALASPAAECTVTAFFWTAAPDLAVASVLPRVSLDKCYDGNMQWFLQTLLVLDRMTPKQRAAGVDKKYLGACVLMT